MSDENLVRGLVDALNRLRVPFEGDDEVHDVDEEAEEAEEDIEPEPEPTRDELLQALREAWGDVINHRTHILHDFTDFFKDELGEE